MRQRFLPWTDGDLQGLPENLDNLLGAMREVMPDIAESDLRTAIAWALRQIPLTAPEPENPASACERRNTNPQWF